MVRAAWSRLDRRATVCSGHGNGASLCGGLCLEAPGRVWRRLVVVAGADDLGDQSPLFSSSTQDDATVGLDVRRRVQTTSEDMVDVEADAQGSPSG